MSRRILQLQNGSVSLSEQRHFETEQELEDAIAAHPEVLPSEDLGLGPLIALGTQIDFGAGPVDLLAADPHGRLAIVEFKRGTENPDVRKVVAQLLDYGSSLWRVPYDNLQRKCAPQAGEDALVSIVAERCLMLDVAFDPEAFRSGIEASLDSGNFVFLYVGRDLDPRTQRIMTYLAEGPRMTFFGVEIDCYQRTTDDVAVLVLRTAFVPSWITEPTGTPGRATSSPAASIATAAPEVRKLIERMETLAGDLGLTVKSARTGRNYEPPVLEGNVRYTSGIGVYASGRGAEFNLSVFRELGEDATADDLLDRIRAVTGEPVTAAAWPAVPCATLVRDWSRTRAELMEPYFHARSSHITSDRPRTSSGSSSTAPTTNTRSRIDSYTPAYSGLIEELRIDVGEYLSTGVISRAQELNEQLGRRAVNDNTAPLFFTGDLDATFVLVHLNPKQRDQPPEYRETPPFASIDDYFDQNLAFGARHYGPAADGLHTSPFDHKQIRFLRPFGVIDFVDERAGDRTARRTNLERAVDRKLQLELIPYGSDAFETSEFARRPELLAPHLKRVTDVIAAKPRDFVIFCGRVLEDLLAPYIVQEHTFTIQRTDGASMQSTCRFANLALPHANGEITAGLAHSWARQGLPMEAYAEAVRRLYSAA